MKISDAPSPPGVAVFSLLCSQSAALHGVAIRLRNAGADLAPSGADGWRGSAASAQDGFVAHLRSELESAMTVVDAARELTDAAIWSMPSGD